MSNLAKSKSGYEPVSQEVIGPKFLTPNLVITILFTFIVTIPFFSGDLYISLFAFIISLRLFFTFPGRHRKKFDMQFVGDSLNERINALSRNIGLKSVPLLLSSKHPKIKCEVFGTFRHHYIVINQEYINNLVEKEEDLKFQEEFDFILAHELTHVKNGDHWKIKLAEYINRIYLIIYVYVTLVSSISSPIIRVGSPIEIVDFLGVPLIALIEVGIMQMFLLIMVQLQEFSADSIAKHLPSTSQGGLAWTMIDVEKKLSVTTKSGIAFLGIFRKYMTHIGPVWSPATEPPERSEKYMHQRLIALNEGQNIGKIFSFACGIMVGSLLANRAIPSLQRQIFLSIFGGSTIGAIYLLNTATKGTRKFSHLLAQIFIAVFSFEIGILAYIGAWASIATILYLPIHSRFFLDTEYQSGVGGMALLLTIVGLILSVSLVLTLPILRWCVIGIERGTLKSTWYITIIISAQVFALTTIFFTIFLQLNMEQSILILLSRLAILALLLAGYNIFIKWLTSLSYNKDMN